MLLEKSKFEMGLKEEFECWLENVEWTEEELKEIDNLSEEDVDDIIGYVLNDDQLTEEMFRSFEWYLRKRLGGQL